MNKKIQFVFLGGEAMTYAFSGAVTFILISRVAGPELLGQYSLVFAWLLIFQSVGNFGIPEFLMREFGRFRGEESKYFNNGLMLGLGSSLAAITLMNGTVYLSGYDPEVKQALTLSSLALLPLMATLICRAGFMAHRRAELILAVALVETALVLSINVYLLLNRYGIVPLIQTLVVGKSISCLVSLYLFSRNIVRWRWGLDLPFCRKLLPAIFTFAVSNVLGLISARVNIIMLSWWGNLAMVGIYAAASKLVELALMLPSIFAQFMLPQIARTFRENANHELKEYEKAFYRLFAVAIALGLGLMYFADPVMHVLLGPSFQESVIVFRVLLVFFLVECLDAILGMVLKAACRQKQDVHLFTSNLVLNVLLNVILIPLFGSLGAALARLAGALASCALRYIYIGRHLVRYHWLGLMVKPFFICAILLGCGFLLREHAHDAVLGTVYLVSSALLLYLTHASVRKAWWFRSWSRDP